MRRVVMPAWWACSQKISMAARFASSPIGKKFAHEGGGFFEVYVEPGRHIGKLAGGESEQLAAPRECVAPPVTHPCKIGRDATVKALSSLVDGAETDGLANDHTVYCRRCGSLKSPPAAIVRPP